MAFGRYNCSDLEILQQKRKVLQQMISAEKFTNLTKMMVLADLTIWTWKFCNKGEKCWNLQFQQKNIQIYSRCNHSGLENLQLRRKVPKHKILEEKYTNLTEMMAFGRFNHLDLEICKKGENAKTYDFCRNLTERMVFGRFYHSDLEIL